MSAPIRLLSDALWKLGDWLARTGHHPLRLNPVERLGYGLIDLSLRLYNPAGTIGLDHPGGHINKADCDAAEGLK